MSKGMAELPAVSFSGDDIMSGRFPSLQARMALEHGSIYKWVIDSGPDAGEFQPGATVRPHEVARLASPWAVDNLEGIAATKGQRGETLLWLISDDNFNPLQRNILLQFELMPAP